MTDKVFYVAKYYCASNVIKHPLLLNEIGSAIGLDARNPVFGPSDQVTYKPAFLAIENSKITYLSGGKKMLNPF